MSRKRSHRNTSRETNRERAIEVANAVFDRKAEPARWGQVVRRTQEAMRAAVRSALARKARRVK